VWHKIAFQGMANSIQAVDRYDEYPHEEIGLAAAHALSAFDSTEAIPGLLEALELSNYQALKSVALAFSSVRLKAMPKLLKALESPNTRIRAGAAFVLGELGNSKS
jgi:HEAT repeat protein